MAAVADVTCAFAARAGGGADVGVEEEFDERDVVVADSKVESRVIVFVATPRRVRTPVQQHPTHVHAPHPRPITCAHERRLTHLVCGVDVGTVAEEEGNCVCESRSTRPVQSSLTEAVLARDVSTVLHENLAHLKIHSNVSISLIH